MTDAQTAALGGIIVALITVLIPLMWQLRRVDRRNTDQHAENGETLNRIEDRQNRLLDLLTDHITNRRIHGDEETNPKPDRGRRTGTAR